MSGSQTSDQEYEVERILDHRNQGAKTEYLIHWKDFGPEEDSWEPVRNLDHCRDLVAHYNRLYRTPVTPGSSTSTLSRLGSAIKMPKVAARSRSRSSSRSRSKKSPPRTKKSPPRSPGRKSSSSPSRRSSRTSSVTKEIVTTSRTGRSPNRSVTKSSSQLTRSPVKEASFSRKLASQVVEESITAREAAKVEHSQFVVQRSFTSSAHSLRQTTGKNRVSAWTSSGTGSGNLRKLRAGALEVSDSEEEASYEKTEDQVDAADTESWFGQKRREMLETLQNRSSSHQQIGSSQHQPLALKDSSGWTFCSYRPLTKCGIRRADIPICIFVTCLVIIMVTFLIEEYF